ERGFQRADERRDEIARLADIIGVEPGAELLLIAATERGELRLRLLERDAGLEPRDWLGVAGAILHLHGGQAADLEDAGRKDLGGPERIAEVRRHDADDLPGLAVELNRFADDGFAPAEARLPQLVAEDAD